MQYSANLNHVFLPRAAEFLIAHEAVQKSRWIIISWKVTRKSDSATLWLGLTGSGGRRCVYIGGRNPSCSQFLSRSHHLFFFSFFFSLITVYPVAWQADGSDYSVIINHGRKPWERRRDDRMGEGGEGEILWGLTGQHTCRSCPRISACAYFHHLDGSDLHQTRVKVIKNYDSARKTFFFFFSCCRCEIFDIGPIEPDRVCKCCILWSLILKDEISFKITSLWQVLRVYLSSMAWSCPGSSLVPRPVSPSVTVCLTSAPAGLHLSQLFSTHRLLVCRFTQKLVSAAALITHHSQRCV